MTGFNTILEAVEDLKQGKMIIVVDDEDRENEGDLLMAADMVTPEAINFMAKYGRGLICMPALKEKFDEINLPLMVRNNTDSFKTAFTISIDGSNTTTGISAYDRCETIRQFTNKDAKESDFKTPGHMFPLVAKDGGVLVRNGHTEAAVDLAKIAGFSPVGVICEILKEDGTMARVDDLMKFKEEHDLKIITIADLIKYRKITEVTAQSLVMGEMKRRFKPEFLNRVDDIIMFKSLDKEEIKKIIDIFMNSLANRLKDKDINMEVTDAAKDIMVREGYDPVYGARPLKRYIGNTLETIIARKLIAGQIRNGDTIVVDGDGDNIDIVVK